VEEEGEGYAEEFGFYGGWVKGGVGFVWVVLVVLLVLVLVLVLVVPWVLWIVAGYGVHVSSVTSYGRCRIHVNVDSSITGSAVLSIGSNRG